MNAISTLALQSVIVWSLTTGLGNASFPSGVATLSPQLRASPLTPTAAAYHPRTRTVFLGAGVDVTKMEHGTGGELIDRGRIAIGTADTILRLRVDARRDRLWVLDVGTVRVIDLATERVIRSVALPNWMYAAQGDNCLPDLQLDEQGAAFVSDNVQPKLWRIDPARFSVHEHGVTRQSHVMLDVGFSALAITEHGVMFAAMAAPGLLWRVDPKTFRAENIALSSPVYGACALEGRRAAGSRDVALFVLTASRTTLDVLRIVVAAGGGKARVDAVAGSSTTGHATILASPGALFFAARMAETSGRKRLQNVGGEWVLKPIRTAH